MLTFFERDKTPLLIIFFAAVIRLFYASGYGLGDDSSYVFQINSILSGRYHYYPPYDVFALRPSIILPLALSVKLLGQNEIAFILPVFIASLITLFSCYQITKIIWDEKTALFSTLALSLFPLDWIFSTLMCNDIVAGAYLWGGLALAISGLTRSQVKINMRVFLGSFIMAFATGVKPSLLFAFFPAGIIALGAIMKLQKTKDWKPLLITAFSGVAMGFLILMTFYYLLTGNPFENFLAELRLNHTFFLREYEFHREYYLKLYPKLFFSITPWETTPTFYHPYGMFFIFTFISLVTVNLLKMEGAWISSLSFTVILLIMQFYPLQLFPTYVPIARLPRYISITALPASMVIGLLCAFLYSKGRTSQAALTLFSLVYSVTSILSVRAASMIHNDCMADSRWAAEVTRTIAPEKVYAASESLDYIKYRNTRFGSPDKIQFLLPPESSSYFTRNSLFFVGGCYRIDLLSTFGEVGIPKDPLPKNWTLISTRNSTPSIIRSVPMRAYYIFDNPSANQVNHSELDGYCNPRKKWNLVDRFLPGNQHSMYLHQYTTNTERWEIFNKLSDKLKSEVADSNHSFVDRGFHFSLYQTLNFHNLTPNIDTCIVKRKGGTEYHPQTKIIINESTLPKQNITQEPATYDWWGYEAMYIPGSIVKSADLTYREEVLDIKQPSQTYRIEIFQASR
ncbi:MAG: hypothetical protein KA715_05085 [Xanthomonadaceae bacterium]|nr:hypothetical protein [Xanthomonadaceae bacterium]